MRPSPQEVEAKFQLTDVATVEHLATAPTLATAFLDAGGTTVQMADTYYDTADFEVQPGDTIFMPPGTIHALGPGLLIYEIQETSDLTYRVWDWDRPQTGGRLLHIEKSLAVAEAASQPYLNPLPTIPDGETVVLTHCPYFTLQRLEAQSSHIGLDTEGESFHALTIISGCAEIHSGELRLRLNQYQSALIPAAAGKYTLTPIGHFSILKASVEAANLQNITTSDGVAP